MRQGIPGFIKGVLRRQSEILLPNRDARGYQAWITERLNKRELLYTEAPEPGLLSVLTPVWDGSPVRYIKTLAESIVAQNPRSACEWVILDNGCTNPKLLSFLSNLSRRNWIRVFRLDSNVGIVRGLRYCLERATSRYVLPVDADDYLYPDALRVIATSLAHEKYPALLYTDEDKVIETRFFQPYLKPDWDPVLALNSAYIAHLGIVDREKAIELAAYTDPSTEGSPDWDVFIRFLIAGHTPVHIPEVLYSWRAHAHSTADDAAYKPYVHSSQKAVLRRFLEAQPNPERFTVEYSPLLGGAAHWYFRRKHIDPRPFTSVILLNNSMTTDGESRVQDDYPPERIVRSSLNAAPKSLLPIALEMAKSEGFIQLIGGDVEIDSDASSREWAWEALALFELHPETVTIGGRIRNRKGIITEGGLHFGYEGTCGCPNRGRSFLDPGYFTQMWKQRSVSAVSTQFAIIRASFFVELVEGLSNQASFAFLGAWAGAHAMRTGKRVVYSPFLSGMSDLEWSSLVLPSEEQLFVEMNRDLIPDRRYYSRHLSLEKPFALA